jgi:hypothetical protein
MARSLKNLPNREKACGAVPQAFFAALQRGAYRLFKYE